MKRILIFLISVSGLPILIFLAQRPVINLEEGLVSYPNATRGASDKKFTVVTYNIGYASGDKNNRAVVLDKEEVIANLDNMVLALKKMDPDLLFLQEVDFYSARTYGINQLEVLAKGLHMPYAAYAVTWNKRYVPWPYWPPKVHFGRINSGQAVLSRTPILDQTIYRFEKPEANPFWYNWFYLERKAQRVLIQQDKEIFSVWNIHLEAFDSEARNHQAAQLNGLVAADPKAQILAGDFNSVSQFRNSADLEDHGEALKILHPDFKNAEKPGVYSIPSWDPDRKIDHIYIKNLDFIEMGNAEILASDHLPIWVTLDR